MRLLPTAVTSALTGLAVASLALSLTSAPVSAALYRDPLTKDTVAYVPTIKHPGTNDYRRIKLDITPLKGETVKRFGHEVAANYDVKVVYKKHVLLHRHLGYWRTLAATNAAQRKIEIKSGAFVSAIRKATDLSPTKAKAAAQAAINRELHAQLKSDVRNTVTNVVTGLANALFDPNTGEPITTPSPSFQQLIHDGSIVIAFSSTAPYNYGKQATVTVTGDGSVEDVFAGNYSVVGHLAGDGYTYEFISSEGNFKESYTK